MHFPELAHGLPVGMNEVTACYLREQVAEDYIYIYIDAI